MVDRMKIPLLLQGLIESDVQVAAFVASAVASFKSWIGASQMPLFPEYTDHSITHVEDVLRTAISLSTEKAQKLLSTKDAAVLVLAVCLHDAAMHLTEDGFFHSFVPVVVGSLSKDLMTRLGMFSG